MVQTRRQCRNQSERCWSACIGEFGCDHECQPEWEPSEYWQEHYKLLQSVPNKKFHKKGCPLVCRKEPSWTSLFRYAVDNSLTCLVRQLWYYGLGVLEECFQEYGFRVRREGSPGKKRIQSAALVEELSNAAALLEKVRRVIVPLRETHNQWTNWWEDAVYDCFSFGPEELIIEMLDAGVAPNYCTIMFDGKQITPMDIVFEDGRSDELLQLLWQKGGVFKYHNALNQHMTATRTVLQLYEIECPRSKNEEEDGE